jgi:macrolide transport system ATP-binding/permease protein
METLLNDIGYAVRTMLRAPGWTAMAVLTLALGTGANTAVFGFVDALLFRPAPGVRAPDGVVTVFTSDFSSGPYGDSSYPDFVSIAGGIAAFERTAAEVDALVAPVRIADETERVRISRVSGEYFNVLGLVPNPGRAIAESDVATGASVAVVSDEFWRRALGAQPSAIGSIVKVNDQAVTVVGVAPPQFRGLDLARAIDMWLPLMPPPATAEARGNRGLLVIARLKPGRSTRDAQSELSALAAQLAREFPKTNLGTLDRPREPRPMVVTSAYRISPEFRGQLMSLSAVLMGGVGLVLVLACANVASLLLSRGTARAREIAVRRALGAGSGRLFRQLLTETAVLAFAAGGVGILIAAWTTGVLVSFFPAEQAALLDTSPNWHVVMYAIAVAALSSLLVGVLPAIRSIRPPLAAALRGHGGDLTDRTGSRLRGALVSVQVAIACVLLVGAGLLVQSVAHTLDADLGMRTKDAVLTSVELPATWTPAAGLAFYDQARARIAALPGVESAGWGRALALTRTSRRRFEPEGYTAVPGEDRELNTNFASAGYFETLGIPLREGRTFTTADSADGARVVVVSETLARKYFRGPAVGRHLIDSRRTVLEIVGVVGDTTFLTVADAPPPLVYYPLTQEYLPRMTLIVRTGLPSERLGETVRRELRAVNADVAVFATTTLRDHVQTQLGAERLTASLVSVCGLLALVLAVIGLYGAIAYLVARRTREIGVRIALGATPDRVLALVVGQGLWIAGAGIAAGLVCAAIAARAIPLGLYGVTPIDPRTYVAVTAVLLLTATLAAFVPARRAVRIDPARALAQD